MALHRNIGYINPDQYNDQMTMYETNGGGGGASDTNYSAVVSGLTNQTQQLKDKLDVATSNLLAGLTGTNDVGRMTNTIVDGVATGKSLAETLNGAYNGSWQLGASNAFGTSLSNTMALPSESGLLLAMGTGGFLGASLFTFDLRPSQTHSSFAAAIAAVKIVLAGMFISLLYWYLWNDFMGRFEHLNAVLANAGKSLTGATLGGVLGSVTARFAVANVITVGLAGMPTVVSAFISDYGLSATSPLAAMNSAVSEQGDAPLITGMALMWIWVDKFVPYGVMMTAIVNVMAWKAFSVYFSTLWIGIYRMLPMVTLALLLPIGADAAQIVVDNRLSQPVECVTDRGIESFPPGEREVDMSENFFVSSPQGTNGLTFSYSGPRARLIVVAAVLTNRIDGFLEAEVAREQYVMQGFIVAASIGGLVLVLAFARRTMRIAFGGYRED